MRIGVDIGGTFTDFVLFDEHSEEITTFKLLSTPDNPAHAVLEGLARVSEGGGATIVHGSTVATNALLERKGARTAFVTTRGFRDLLTIARQTRTDIYDFFCDRPEPLVPPDLCFELTERVTRDGVALASPDASDFADLTGALREARTESVALCFLFSFLRPEHEATVSRALRDAGFLVSASAEILPEFREYERASTTAVNAYVAPILNRYLGHLEDALKGRDFRIMQSNGGSIRSDEARTQAVRTILSGPAGGVVGAVHVGQAAGFDRVVGFDMGGTSTDVSLSLGEPQVTTESEIGGLPIRIPVIDIHTVGSGGGSIAYVDAGGALRVGPESAGSDPGPVCYRRGGSRPTVTDANVVLGRLAPERFLGGEMALDVARATKALDELGRQAGLTPAGSLTVAQTAALGVVAVVNAHMERAVRVISVERGHDPTDFVFLSFGGAGGLHACDLARGLGMDRVLAPYGASTLSAFGMLVADVVKDYVRTVMLPGDTAADDLAEMFAPLVERGAAETVAEGVSETQVTVHRELDMRYRGQSYELTVPFAADYAAAFHRAHEERYGHGDAGTPVEIVNLRVRAVGSTPTPALRVEDVEGDDPSVARRERREVVLAGGVVEADFYDGEALRPGSRIVGPAVIMQRDTTILLGDGDRACVDARRNVLVEVSAT
ncbi:hydantoinase/oxoprolinase family protein [Candidatus Poribacteria bacterium]|nr:hydantoinase/oxoprolinase family protein [Candidatus Poribacteria bacterium]MBT5535630.1 hydantoinase/oxoprolinase family protein [Candidatus Poribacteria bacterium]MBT5709664.1 hydantoinase/oxoprolinase family protein [Candidatus Poribacteria bacterium]MBT7099105.1 hydantoinase/oxoprolinase family protein [Candidatus Poribacteria bacterium]MBT7804315.1 hydantoinase/oxoprolinase family protein [Candidatus Poribacteria bacterium]